MFYMIMCQGLYFPLMFDIVQFTFTLTQAKVTHEQCYNHIWCTKACFNEDPVRSRNILFANKLVTPHFTQVRGHIGRGVIDAHAD